MLTGYEALWVLTRQMLEAAGNSDWDRLIVLQHEREVVVAGIQAAGAISLESSATQARLVQVIRQIMEADAQIRLLTETWMTELSGILGSLGTEQKLQQAYDTR